MHRYPPEDAHGAGHYYYLFYLFIRYLFRNIPSIHRTGLPGNPDLLTLHHTRFIYTTVY